MAKRKPFEQLSPSYRRRIENAQKLGYTRSQARGHPGKGLTKISVTPPPAFTGGGVTTGSIKAGKGIWQINPNASRTIVSKGVNPRTFNYTVFDLTALDEKDMLTWPSKVKSLLKSKYGKHKVYRLIATIERTANADELLKSSSRLKSTKIKDDEEIYESILGTGYEQVPGTSNIAEIDMASHDGQVMTITIDFRD